MELEIEARDKAQGILLEAENEASRRMKEISRQENRLQERRTVWIDASTIRRSATRGSRNASSGWMRGRWS